MLANSPMKESPWKWLSCCSAFSIYPPTTCPCSGVQASSQEASVGTHSTEGHGQHRLHLGGLHRPDDPFSCKAGREARQGPELHVFDPNHTNCVSESGRKFHHEYALSRWPPRLATLAPMRVREPGEAGLCSAQKPWWLDQLLDPITGSEPFYTGLALLSNKDNGRKLPERGLLFILGTCLKVLALTSAPLEGRRGPRRPRGRVRIHCGRDRAGTAQRDRQWTLGE